jgi:hypothetical protein
MHSGCTVALQIVLSSTSVHNTSNAYGIQLKTVKFPVSFLCSGSILHDHEFTHEKLPLIECVYWHYYKAFVDCTHLLLISCRITGTASSSPTVTTRARAARTAASAASTATAAANTEAPATTKTPAAAAAAAAAAGLASGAEHQQQQQRPTGATTRSRAAVFGISSIPAAAALSADSGSSSPDAAKAGVGSSKGSSSKQAAKTVICGICLDDVSSSSMYRLGELQHAVEIEYTAAPGTAFIPGLFCRVAGQRVGDASVLCTCSCLATAAAYKPSGKLSL